MDTAKPIDQGHAFVYADRRANILESGYCVLYFGLDD